MHNVCCTVRQIHDIHIGEILESESLLVVIQIQIQFNPNPLLGSVHDMTAFAIAIVTDRVILLS